MSVVNDMLRDLQRRQGERPVPYTPAAGLQAPGHTPRVRLRQWLGVGALVTVAAAWWWSAGQARALPAAALAPPPTRVPNTNIVAVATPLEINMMAPATAPLAPVPVVATQLRGVTVRGDASRFTLTLDMSAPVAYEIASDAAQARVDVRLPHTVAGVGLEPQWRGATLRSVAVEAMGADLRLRVSGATPLQLVSARYSDVAEHTRLIVDLSAAAPAVQAPAAEPTAAPPVAETAAATLQKSVRMLTPLQRAENALQRALDALKRNALQEAEAALLAALEADPNHARARETLAAVWVNGGRATEAEALLTQLAAPTPGETMLLARLLAERGALTEAVAALEGAAPPVTVNAAYHALLGALYQRAGRHAEAVQRYGQALSVEPGQAGWWAGLGIALDAVGRPVDARAAYGRAYRLPGLERALHDYIGARLKATEPAVPLARR